MNGRHWLRVPIGKLHNDRYVPLHPQLVEQLDDHQRHRSDDLDRLIVFDGRRLDRHMVARMVRRVAKAAGIGHVHPHQLRHTLATQAINRGMSLEAIAAMLGHKTLRMTLVYARIADRTVADAYDRVTNEVDALYTKPNRAQIGARRHRRNGAPRCRVRPETPRQRPLQPTRPARLPVRIDLRILRLLLDQHSRSSRSSKPNAITPPNATSTTASTSSTCSSTEPAPSSHDPTHQKSQIPLDTDYPHKCRS